MKVSPVVRVTSRSDPSTNVAPSGISAEAGPEMVAASTSAAIEANSAMRRGCLPNLNTIPPAPMRPRLGGSGGSIGLGGAIRHHPMVSPAWYRIVATVRGHANHRARRCAAAPRHRRRHGHRQDRPVDRRSPRRCARTVCRREIISADSRQVFRGLDIGTAKAPAGGRGGDPAPRARSRRAGRRRSRWPTSFGTRAGRCPGSPSAVALAILVGGTGLYLRAVARGLDAEALPSDAEVRARIEAGLASDGLEPAVARLQDLAPRLASRIDLANPRRVARALEIAELRGDAPPPPPLGYAGPVRLARPAPRPRRPSRVDRPARARAVRRRAHRGGPGAARAVRPGAAGVLRDRLSRGVGGPRRDAHAQAQALELDVRRNVAVREAPGDLVPLRAGHRVAGRDDLAAPTGPSRSRGACWRRRERGEGAAGPRRRAVALDPAKVHAWRIERQLLGRVEGRVAGRCRPNARRRAGPGDVVRGASPSRCARSAGRGKAPATDATTGALRDRRPRPFLGDARHAPPLRRRRRPDRSPPRSGARTTGADPRGSAGSASPSPRWTP